MIRAAGHAVLLIWVALIGPMVLLGLDPPGSRPSAGIVNGPLAQNAHRVAVYAPVLSAYVTAAGTSEHVVAASEIEKEVVAGGIFGEIFPTLRDIPALITIGGQSAVPADPEQILSLAPDKVITWAAATGGLEKIGVLIEGISSADLIVMWQRVAQISGKPDVFADLVASFVENERDLYESVGPLEEAKRRVLLMWRNDAGSWRIASDGYRDIQFLKRIGAADPPRLSQDPRVRVGSFAVNLETVLKFNPEIIFLPCCATIFDTPQSVYGDPVMQAVDAVRNRRVYKMPIGGTRMDGLVEYPLLLRWYAEILYPDKFEREWRKTFRDAYARNYNYSMTSDAMDEMLFVRQNADSVGYSRFLAKEKSNHIP